jgi:hypothetical protein
MRVSDPAPKRGLGRQRPGADRNPGPAERRRAFIAQLDRMSPQERLRASRYSFERWQLILWAARYPEEAPLVNGEYEWVATRLADLD